MTCQCETCKRACTYMPGWFAPGEAEKAAIFMGMPLQEFFNQYLRIDYMDIGNKSVYGISPNVKGADSSRCAPLDPSGECVFFTDQGLCQIHKGKPRECRLYDCAQDIKRSNRITVVSRKSVNKWAKQQDYVDKLYLEGGE